MKLTRRELALLRHFKKCGDYGSIVHPGRYWRDKAFQSLLKQGLVKYERVSIRYRRITLTPEGEAALKAATEKKP